jgi:hypothetical protein
MAFIFEFVNGMTPQTIAQQIKRSREQEIADQETSVFYRRTRGQELVRVVL